MRRELKFRVYSAMMSHVQVPTWQRKENSFIEVKSIDKLRG